MANFSKRHAKRLSIVVLACSALVPSQQALAGMPVVDFSSIASSVAIGIQRGIEQGKSLAHQGAQAANWGVEKADRLKQLQQLQQDLVTLSANPMLAMVNVDDKFIRRSPLYGLAAACSTGGSFDPMIIWQDFAGSLTGDFKKQQAELCKRILVVENRKYNATVDLLEQLKRFDDSLSSIEKRRKVRGSAPGQTASLDNDLAAFAGNMQLDLNGWSARMAAYDNHIAQLRTEQNRLARVAMRGQPSFFGEVMKPIALKSALENL